MGFSNRNIRIFIAAAILVIFADGASVAQDLAASPTALEQGGADAVPPAAAQAAPAAMPEGSAADNPAAQQNASAEDMEYNFDEMMPIVHNYWEHAAVMEARRARGMVRPPSEEELARSLRLQQTPKQKPPPEEREIKLQGIVYVSASDWAIWLNGKRVTPEALPRETLDLKVFKEYVEMKWFDEYTNQIFPLRLRPHERFNIDTRIFLPD